MKKASIALITLVSSMLALSVSAQEMPAPRRMPRTPVSKETLYTGKSSTPLSRQVQGTATAIDGETIRIGDTDLRLFGVVPPQLSASFGPQARAEIDSLVSGQSVSCQIRDRGRDGRLLATCRNASGTDLALGLLKRGLAVTARGSIAETELSSSYSAAEQAAQNQKIGLWSVAVAAPAIVPPATKQETANQTTVELPLKKEESDKKEDKKDDKTATPADKTAQTVTAANITADVLSERQQDQDEFASTSDIGQVGFFERYQIMISGFLMLATAAGITIAFWEQKNRERREDTKALAAALRGELMAARSVCIGRSRSITNEQEDKTAHWPRIRSTLYQACVGRLGSLGAEMARQISSIYGQLNDYAALYNSSNPPETTSKKQALDSLNKRIEDLLPKLAEIESTGRLPSTQQRPAAPPTPPADVTTQEVAAASTQSAPPAQPQKNQKIRATVALWETVRSFIQSHGSSNDQAAAPPLPQIDPQTAEYAAMIEADMARYQYGENLETLDISPHKKRG